MAGLVLHNVIVYII